MQSSTAAAGTAMIRVENLVKTFNDPKRGEVHAVDRVSFDVHRGEVFGLLGPNGAGKTTTLRMLATLLKPTSGTATLDGFDIDTRARQGSRADRLSFGRHGSVCPPDAARNSRISSAA